MGPRPTYEDENGFYSATSLPASAALPFVISTGAHPDSCLAPLDKTARAPFFKERRILFASATNFYRKSGVAERRDLCVDVSSWKCFSTERTRISYLTALTGDHACGSR
jgi:hypothetical protein